MSELRVLRRKLMSEVERVGVSLDKKLLSMFDQLITSTAIQIALRQFGI